MTTNRVRLPRSSVWTMWGMREEVWLCDTHLLCIKNMFGTEIYQRFYYRDIESVSVAVTKERVWVTSVLAAVTGLLALWFVAAELPAAVFAVLLTPLMMAIFVNANDSTCKTVLTTRVNTRRLSSLKHLRVTRKALALLCERVCAAQRGENSGSAEHQLGQATDTAQHLESVAELVLGAPGLSPPPLPVTAAHGGKWHYVALGLMIVQLPVGLWTAFAPSGWTLGVSALLVFLCGGACVRAQIALRRRTSASSLKTAYWVVLGYELLLAYGIVMVFAFAQRVGSSYTEMLTEFLDKTGSLVPVVCLCHAAVALLFAVWLGVKMWEDKTP